MSSAPEPWPTSLDDEIFWCDVTARDRDGARLRLAGQLDISSVPALSAQIGELRQTGARQITVDLSQLTFMDGGGVHFFLDCCAAARSAGCTIALVPGPRAVQRVFELTSTMSRLPFVDE